jgi:phosphate transport system substrate-binding protein
MLLIAALVLAPLAAFAQDDEAAQDNDTTDGVSVVGSGVVARVFEALRAASEVEIALNVNTGGTVAGLQAFCVGEADIALANRPLTADEALTCEGSLVNFVEVLLANDILAFITHPDNTAATCLNEFDLDTLLAPSASGTVVDWGGVTGETGLALGVVLPPANTPVFAYLDRLVSGDGARNDAQIAADDAGVIAAVAETPGALGVVALASLSGEAADGVRILDLNNADLSACISPSASSVEAGDYGAGERLFAYVNAESLTQPGLNDLLGYIASDDAPTALTSAGFSAPSEAAYATLRDSLANTTTGRVFSREVIAFTIPADVTGEVAISGTAAAASYLESLTTNIQGSYAGLTVTPTLRGDPEAVRGLCNGDANLIVTQAALTDEEMANCAANSVTPLTYSLGARAVVLLASTSSDYLACLTPEQIASAVRAAAAESLPATWSALGDGLGEDPVLLFAPFTGDPVTDLLLSLTAGQAAPVREDAEISGDVLYRAAATANVPGALTFMTWTDYQDVLSNAQANIQLVAVDGGDGCVTPGVETITDGTYPLARPLNVIVNKASLTDIAVQSWLWAVFSDQNHSLFTASGWVGVPFESLDAVRSELQTAFDEAAAEAEAAAAAALEATPTEAPEATAEGEATPEGEATAEDEATAEGDTTPEGEATPEDEATSEGEATPEAEATPTPAS